MNLLNRIMSYDKTKLNQENCNCEECISVKNVKLFGSTKRTEWLEQPSVETNTSTSSSVSRLALQALSVKQEKEATTL